MRSSSISIQRKAHLTTSLQILVRANSGRIIVIGTMHTSLVWISPFPNILTSKYTSVRILDLYLEWKMLVRLTLVRSNTDQKKHKLP